MMSVDMDGEQFHATRVSAADLGDRLNAQAYRPAILDAIRTIKKTKWRPLSQIVEGKLSQGQTPVYADTGPLCLKTRHVRSVAVSDEHADCVSAEFAAANLRNQIEAGTVVMNRSGIGSIGRTAVYLGRDPIHTNEELFRFRLRKPHDPAFVACFFSTWWGERALEQGITGATRQLKLAQDYVLGVPVMTPAAEAQAYIGSKVRQADGLRDRGHKVVRAVEEFFALASTPFRSSRSRASRVPISHLADRLDPGHYPKDVRDHLGQLAQPLKTLGELCGGNVFSGATLAPVAAEVQQVTVANLDKLFLGGEFRLVKAPRNEERRLRPHDLLIASAAHTASYIGKDVTYAVVSQPTYASTEVLVVRPDRSQVPASYLWCVLRSQFGYLQIQACVRGITAHAYADDLSRVVVPVPASSVVGRFEVFDLEMINAARCVYGARSLVHAAKLLVQALIERQISERELIEAGRDPAADTALLARLTSKGLDAGGDPLFPDLDAHRALVADAGGAP